MMLTLSPAIFTLLSLLISYICSVLFKNYQMRSQRDMSFWPAFYQLRADRILSVLFLVIFLLNAFAPMGMFYDLSINVIVILAGIFFCFGLAYIDWRMRFGGIKALPRRLIVIACIPLCMMFFMLPLLIITTIGVLDGIFDFRSRTVKKYHDGEMPRQ